MDRYLVKRPNDTVEVAILPCKSDGKYSFVNLTKGHICSCKFDMIEEAISDMERLKIEGKIINYKKL